MEDLFTNRSPNETQADALDQLTDQMNSTHALLVSLLPDSRERSLAITKLEECSMWAKKGVVFRLAVE